MRVSRGVVLCCSRSVLCLDSAACTVTVLDSVLYSLLCGTMHVFNVFTIKFSILTIHKTILYTFKYNAQLKLVHTFRLNVK